MKMKFEANETVIKANNVEFMPSTGVFKGKLILTNQRLYFIRTADDSEKGRISILASDIIDVLPFKKSWFSKVLLGIQTRNEGFLKFKIKNANQWIESIAAIC